MFTLLALSAALAGPTVTFQPEAQVRPRFEAHTGRDGVEGGDAWFVNLRTRLGATMGVGQFSVRAVVQDVRLFGEESGTFQDFTADGLDMHFGYVQWSPSEAFGVRIGRQEFNLHEDRLIGNLDWLPQARAFDGVRTWFGGEQWSGEVVAAMTGNVLSAAHESNKGLFYTRLGYKGAMVADAVYILDHVEDRDRLVHTAGAYLKGKAGLFSGRLEGYGQFGDTDGQTVRAFLVGAQATIAPQVATKPSFTLWYDYMSGNGDDATVRGQFDTLYATNHKFYGLADIAWFRTGGPVDGRGLQDGALKIALSPVKGVTLKVHGHVFFAANDPDSQPYIGAEPDLLVVYKPIKPVAIVSGVGVFVPREGGTDVWGFTQVSASFR
jgi:hypothetical protein